MEAGMNDWEMQKKSAWQKVFSEIPNCFIAINNALE